MRGVTDAFSRAVAGADYWGLGSPSPDTPSPDGIARRRMRNPVCSVLCWLCFGFIRVLLKIPP